MLLVCNNFELRCFLSAVVNSRGHRSYMTPGVKSGYGVVGGCFTDVVLHSSKNYYR
jgi:hypothetical protein